LKVSIFSYLASPLGGHCPNIVIPLDVNKLEWRRYPTMNKWWNV